MKIVYTPSGQQALEDYIDRRVQELEEHISSQKYVFGDDIVEITSADVKEASNTKRSIPRPFLRHPAAARSVLSAYIVVGLCTALVGMFYDHFIELVYRNPIQLVLVISGLGISLASYAMLQRFRAGEKEIEIITRFEQLQREASINKEIVETFNLTEKSEKEKQLLP